MSVSFSKLREHVEILSPCLVAGESSGRDAWRVEDKSYLSENVNSVLLSWIQICDTKRERITLDNSITFWAYEIPRRWMSCCSSNWGIVLFTLVRLSVRVNFGFFFNGADGAIDGNGVMLKCPRILSGADGWRNAWQGRSRHNTARIITIRMTRSSSIVWYLHQRSLSECLRSMIAAT